MNWGYSHHIYIYIYIYQYSKLLKLHLFPGLPNEWAFYSGQHALYSPFLPRPARKEEQLRSHCLSYIIYCARVWQSEHYQVIRTWTPFYLLCAAAAADPPRPHRICVVAAVPPPRRRLRGRKKAVKAAFDDMISRRTPLYTPPLPLLNASNIWIDDSWVASG